MQTLRFIILVANKYLPARVLFTTGLDRCQHDDDEDEQTQTNGRTSPRMDTISMSRGILSAVEEKQRRTAKWWIKNGTEDVVW